MVSTGFAAVVAATSIFSLAATTAAQSIASATYTGPLRSLTYKGCYSDSEPLVDHGEYIFQTSGNCQPVCVGLGKAVMGLVNGTNCFCGDLLPAEDSEVDEDNCDTPCAGFDQESCGGNNYWSVYLTGATLNSVGHFGGSSARASSTAVRSSDAAAIVTVGGSTVLVTMAPGGDSGPNKVGIAVGVVVGVVVISSIVGGVFLYLRHRRRKMVEEEYRRQAAVNAFVAGGKHPPGSSSASHSSVNDTRLDPEVVMQRRASDGSIADNEDYSRRILKVVNPDR
ncbi:hypothetical protein BDY21DRAFT_282204 [Lineolata rhizophorae]|uniref:WSC domain-containing protein n=1 Tax=Lineolata rhizophorae TaxID=578093 RepID=A0A6A6P660_9PEZI|nr:hypothetical protein BDY21DRAFT_282204 [Lineolata rhizophorae]